MAKKKKVQPNRSQKNTGTVNLSLPQNIVLVGESNPEDKKVYISQSTYKEIYRFTKNKIINERGGVLLGNMIEEFGKTHIVIRAFIEAKYCEGTPTTLKFTHESWEYIYKEAAKKYPSYKILGWIHTHPDFGIFLSEYDKFIHENFFNKENQIAYVIDPIQNVEGFYFWLNGKIERCKGFFLFDKNDVKITVEQETGEGRTSQAVYQEGRFLIRDAISAVIGGGIVALIIACFSLHSKVNVLQDQQRALVDSANSSLYNMSVQINSLYGEIDSLKERLSSLETTESELEQETKEEFFENGVALSATNSADSSEFGIERDKQEEEMSTEVRGTDE